MTESGALARSARGAAMFLVLIQLFAAGPTGGRRPRCMNGEVRAFPRGGVAGRRPAPEALRSASVVVGLNAVTVRRDRGDTFD